MFSTVHAASQQESQAVSPVQGQAASSADAILSVLDETNSSAAVDVAEPQIGVSSLPPERILSDFHQNVMLDQEGGFAGRLNLISTTGDDLSAASNYTVRVLQRGMVIGETVSDVNGEFRFRNLQPGVVGFVAYSPQGLAMFGCRLVEAEPAAAAAQAALTNLSTTVITGRDAVAARQMLLAALSMNGHRFEGELLPGEELFPMGGTAPANSISYHAVELGPDGTFSGEVNIMDERTGRYREVHDMTVHVIRDGRQIAAAAVENDGSFSIVGMTPGVVAFVGTGLDGVFGTSLIFEAAGSTTASTVPSPPGEYQPAVSLFLNNFGISPIGAGTLNQGNANQVNNPDQQGLPGGFGGGAGGGGGGIGGGGGLAALLTGIAAGIGGYYAGKDDNNPASPGN
jgi:hypothetical protein